MSNVLTPEEIAALADASRVPPVDITAVGLASQIRRALDDGLVPSPDIVRALAERVLSANGIIHPHARE